MQEAIKTHHVVYRANQQERLGFSLTVPTFLFAKNGHFKNFESFLWVICYTFEHFE